MVTGLMARKKKSENLDTSLRLNDLDKIRESLRKKPEKVVEAKKQSLGYVRYTIRSGRIYYSWVRIEYRPGNPPRQETVMYIGKELPLGVRLGKVNEKMAKKLWKWKRGY